MTEDFISVHGLIPYKNLVKAVAAYRLAIETRAGINRVFALRNEMDKALEAVVEAEKNV